MSNRLEILKSMVAQNPADSFSRYGLAMEYRNTRRSGGGDARVSRTAAASIPITRATYFHAGQTLERLGRIEEAREMYQRASRSRPEGRPARTR